MFGLGVYIYQEDKCLWHKGNSTGTNWWCQVPMGGGGAVQWHLVTA